MNPGDLAVPAHHRGRLPHLRPESMDERWKCERWRPAATVGGIVVAMDHEAGNAGGGQARQSVAESRLAEESGTGDLEDIARHHHEVDALTKPQLDDVVPGVGRRGPQDGEHVRRRLGAQALERAVEMEVTGVQEPERIGGRHGPPSVADGRDSSSVAWRAWVCPRPIRPLPPSDPRWAAPAGAGVR